VGSIFNIPYIHVTLRDTTQFDSNVLGRVQFLYRLKVEKNNELQGTDNIQGQISEHIFEVFIFYNP